MSHEQPHKRTKYHTLIQNLNAYVYGSFPHLYSTFSLLLDIELHLILVLQQLVLKYCFLNCLINNYQKLIFTIFKHSVLFQKTTK